MHTVVVTVRLRVGAIAAAATLTLGLAACGKADKRSESKSKSESATTTTAVRTTTPTTVPPREVSVPPAPPLPPRTTAPPPITVPVTSTPRTTTTRGTTTTRATTTTRGTTTTTSSTTTTSASGATAATQPGPVTRKTVVYTPTGAPKRKGELVVPRDHHDAIVVLVHGGGGTAGSRKQLGEWQDFYAAHGYATFSIDYFLFKPTTPSPVYPRPEREVKAAVQWLRDHAGEIGVDPGKVVVQGFSAGGRLAAQAYTTPNDAYYDGPGRYPATSDGVAGLIGFYGPYNGVVQVKSEQYYGGPPDSRDQAVRDRYAHADSVAHASGAIGPALLFQGDKDKPVLIDSARRFADALGAAGRDTKLVVVAGAGHAFDLDKGGRFTSDGKQTAQQCVDWLDAHFK